MAPPAVHGKLVEDVDWRIEEVTSSKHGDGLALRLVVLTLGYRKGDRRERITLHLGVLHALAPRRKRVTPRPRIVGMITGIVEQDPKEREVKLAARRRRGRYRIKSSSTPRARRRARRGRSGCSRLTRGRTTGSTSRSSPAPRS